MKHEEFLKQVKERAEGGMDILREPPLSAETARLQMVIRSGRPDDVLELLAIIELLESQRDDAITREWMEHEYENARITYEAELDEIVGLG